MVEVSYRIPGGSSKLRRPADTMLVMGRSGSMSGAFFGKTKIQAAKEALKAFVDQTQEDEGVDHPGDYVGLSTYSSSATLNFSIANMTAGNKTAIKNAIDSLNANGITSIGAGIDIANKELLNLVEPASTSRAGVPKFMVLASDGIQNTRPSPYQNNILQTAIDNEIVIFTVGIGNDVGYEYNFNPGTGQLTSAGGENSCIGCVDLDGPGVGNFYDLSGEEVLKDIACKTDQHRFDPADNCQMTWNTGNDPSVNDLDSPAHYFFADDPAKLTQVYKEVANEITSAAWYQLIEQINTGLFGGIVPNSISIVDCKTGLDWDAQMLMKGGDSFFYILKNVGEDDEVCVSFDAIVSPDAVPGVYWVNQTGLVAVWDPEFECDKDGNGIINIIELIDCILIGFFELPNIQITNVKLEVIDPAEPWLKTTGGDVGSATTKIDMARDGPPIPGDNADYLVIVGGATRLIKNFTSARDWLIEEYSDPDGVAIKPEPVGGSMYTVLLEKYRKRCPPETPVSNTPGSFANAAAMCNILQVHGDLDIDNDAWAAAGYKGDPAVVFISGDMNIDRDIEIAADTGLIFVARGDILIQGGVKRIDGIYSTDGDFKTYENVTCGSTGSNNQQLTINGAVHVFGEACFTRSLPPLPNIPNNRDDPAEIINYEPKYLWLFKEIIGDKKLFFKEVAP